jgi:uncharacterized coiled-coil protein SlyX
MYYMSDQIVQLESRVDALEAQNAAMQESIRALNSAVRTVIRFIGEKFRFAT